MKEKLLNFIVCPACGESLTLKAGKKAGDNIKDGILICTCGESFPITAFVPRGIKKAGITFKGFLLQFFKCFWNDDFSFEENDLVNLTGTTRFTRTGTRGKKWKAGLKTRV